MAKQEREQIEYEFEDLRRNSDPVSALTLAQFGITPEDVAERHEGKSRKEPKRKDDDEEIDDRDDDDRDLDGDDEVTLTRKELSRRLTEARRTAERNARDEIRAAKDEAAEVIGKLEKRVEGIERRGTEKDIDDEFQPKIKDLEQQIHDAMEAGESAKVVALNRELAEVVAEQKLKKHTLSLKRTNDDLDDADRQPQPRVIPRAKRWIEKQADWWDDPEEAHIRAYVNKLDRDLQAEGYRPTDEDFYERLEAEVDKKFPGVINRTTKRRARDEGDDDDDDEFERRRERSRRDEIDDDEDDDDEDRRARARRRQREAGRRAPVNDDRGGVTRDRKQRRERSDVTLTARDLANMRAFGLDPDNKQHIEEYTLEKRRSRSA